MAEDKHTKLVAELAAATGVAAADVDKLLAKLGVSRAYKSAVAGNRGKDLPLSAVRVGFKVGKAIVIS